MESHRDKMYSASNSLSEDMNVRLLDHAPMGVCLMNPEGEIRYINSKACEIIGFSGKEWTNTYLKDYVLKSDRASFDTAECPQADVRIGCDPDHIAVLRACRIPLHPKRPS